jgi:hypothetical protein
MMAHTVDSSNNKVEAVLEVVMGANSNKVEAVLGVVMGASKNKVEVVMGATVVMVTRWTSS